MRGDCKRPFAPSPKLAYAPIMTEDDVRAALKAETDKTDMHEWGRRQKPPISPGYINDVIKGRKPPGPKILAALGFEKGYFEIG
jgi:hypothetical protein